MENSASIFFIGLFLSTMKFPDFYKNITAVKTFEIMCFLHLFQKHQLMLWLSVPSREAAMHFNQPEYGVSED